MSESSHQTGTETPASSGEEYRQINPDFIATIEKKGDVFDKVRKQTKHFAAHTAIRAGSLTTGLAVGLFGDWSYLAPRHFVYGLVAGGAFEAKRRTANNIRSKKIGGILAENHAMSAAANEPLELVRQNSRKRSEREVQLYWGAEFGDNTTSDEVRQRLEAVAELAERSTISTVVIPDDVIKHVDPAVRAGYKPKRQKVSTWLKETKRKMPIGQDKLDDPESQKAILKLTPDECLELAQHIELLEQEDPKLFEYAWNILKHERPNHVVFRDFAGQFDRLSDTSVRNGIHHQARQTIARHMALALDDTTVRQGPNGERVRVNMRGTIDSKQPNVRLQGAQRIDTAHGEEAVHAEESGNLLGHLGIQPLDLRLFFESPGKLSQKKRIQAAEAVMLFELAGWNLPYTPDLQLDTLGGEKAEDPQEGRLYPSLQQSTAIVLGMTNKAMRRNLGDEDFKAAMRIDLGKFQKSRAVRLTGALLLAFILSHDVTSQVVNAPANYLYYQRERQYIADLPNRDIDEIVARLNEEANESSQTTRQELADAIRRSQERGRVDTYILGDDFDQEAGSDPYNDLLFEGYKLDREVRDKVAELAGSLHGTDDFAEDGSETRLDMDTARDNTSELEQQDEAGVGNVDSSGGNKPLWKLESSGMDTSGLWAQRTHNQLTAGYGMFWQSSLTRDTKTKTIPTKDPDEVTATDEWIRVSSVKPVEINKSYFFSEDALVSIPVLEGTVPASITIKVGDYGSNHTKSVPAQVIQLEDGTFMAAIEGGYESELLDGGKTFFEYLLVPAETGPKLPFGSVRARTQVNTDSLISFESGEPTQTDLELSKADDAVDSYVNGLPEGGLKRTDALADYIRSNFQYALTPFELNNNGKEVYEDIETASDYIDLVFNAKKRLANCNTANTALIIDNPTQLNAVTGYRNSPSTGAYDTLSAADAHMWAVDGDGEYHDATPSDGLSDKDAAYFEENFTEEDFKPPKSSADEWRKRFETAKQITAVGAIGLAAAYTLRKRKRVAEAARGTKQAALNVRAGISEKRLQHTIATKPRAVRAATEVVEHAIFSNGSSQKPVTQFNTLTPIGSEAVRRSLLISNSQGMARKKVKTAAKGGAFSQNEQAAVKLAKRLLKLSSHTEQRTL